MMGGIHVLVLLMFVASARGVAVGSAATVASDARHPHLVPVPTSASLPMSPLNQGNNTADASGDHIVAETGEWLEKLLKTSLKYVVKEFMAGMIDSGEHPKVSPKCLRSLMKYVNDLTKTKIWALKMLDSSSKLPAGVMEGTIGDFGSFDECLEIRVPLRNGSENFRGMYCSIEAAPRLPPIPKNYITPKQFRAKPDDVISAGYKMSSSAFYFLKSRLGLCVPSSCSVDDVRKLVGLPSAVNTRFDVRVTKCYVDEGIKWHPVHFVVLCVLALLTILAISGTYLDYFVAKNPSKNLNTGIYNVLGAFSLSSNGRRLLSTEKSNLELRVLHGIRFLSIAWVILGHCYAWADISILRRPLNALLWFQSFEYGAILNGWLAVDVFFFLSGFLASYSGLHVMEKAKGKLPAHFFILYRYLRLTPTLLLAMGLLFFLPVISSGPFYDKYVDPEIESCKNNWWKNIIYISNWIPMKQMCIYPTWYLSADFQLSVMSLFVLMILYRSTILGMLTLGLLTLTCNVLVGTLTYLWELPPAVLISSGNTKQIFTVLDLIHMKTYTHVGPYCVGMAIGYIIFKRKHFQLRKWQNTLGWCASTILSLCSVYGIYVWNMGYTSDPLVSALYAAVHRTTFALGVAWVVFACATGNGGPVNWILSSTHWIPLSRLTYMCYLLHSLVMWTRGGSLRERHYASHYNALYEYTTDVVFVVALSVPFYLLMEAPVSRLLRMFFENLAASKIKDNKSEDLGDKEEPPTPCSINVELKCVKTLHSGDCICEMSHSKINRCKIN